MARENRHGAKTMSGQRRFPDMAQKRCRDRGVSPTWRKNDVGTEAFPRHGATTMSGQRRFPDMAQKRCRDRGVSPTWRKNDVGSHAHNLKNRTKRPNIARCRAAIIHVSVFILMSRADR